VARYGYPNLRIDVDDSSGTPQNMSAYITSDCQAEIEAVLEEVTAAGDAAEAWAKVGLSRMAAFSFAGPFDDTASTGPDAVFKGIGAVTRTVKFTWGGSKTTSVEAIIAKYKRIASQGKLTGFEATMQPTGAVTEA